MEWNKYKIQATKTRYLSYSIWIPFLYSLLIPIARWAVEYFDIVERPFVSHIFLCSIPDYCLSWFTHLQLFSNRFILAAIILCAVLALTMNILGIIELIGMKKKLLFVKSPAISENSMPRKIVRQQKIDAGKHKLEKSMFWFDGFLAKKYIPTLMVVKSFLPSIKKALKLSVTINSCWHTQLSYLF